MPDTRPSRRRQHLLLALTLALWLSFYGWIGWTVMSCMWRHVFLGNIWSTRTAVALYAAFGRIGWPLFPIGRLGWEPMVRSAAMAGIAVLLSMPVGLFIYWRSRRGVPWQQLPRQRVRPSHLWIMAILISLLLFSLMTVTMRVIGWYHMLMPGDLLRQWLRSQGPPSFANLTILNPLNILLIDYLPMLLTIAVIRYILGAMAARDDLLAFTARWGIRCTVTASVIITAVWMIHFMTGGLSHHPLSPGYYGASLVTLLCSIVLLFCTASGWLWHIARARAMPGYCERCGYDLRGNAPDSPACPECGYIPAPAPTDDAPAQA